MIAITAANANAPAKTSFGLCSTFRIAKPRSASALAVFAPRRRRGMSSSLVTFLGTFLHLVVVVLDCRSCHRNKGRDIPRWLLWLRESQRQRNGHRSALVD